MNAVLAAGSHESLRSSGEEFQDGRSTQTGTARGAGQLWRAKRYRMREKVLSIGDDFWIEDDSGQKVFKVKALRVRKTLVFESPDGVERCKIQERKLRVRDSMEIEGPDGERLAMVRKAMVTPLRERWVAEMGDGTELRVQGNTFDHEYELEYEGAMIAQVSKRWFRGARHLRHRGPG